MLQEITVNIFEKKWSAFSSMQFPVKEQKLVSSSVLDDFLRQFFFAETNHYCNSVLEQWTNEHYLSDDIKGSDDAENIRQILFDWIQFDENTLRSLLFFGIQTEVYFLFNPVKSLLEFNFSDDANLEIKIEDLISSLDFFDNMQNIVATLQKELYELGNRKSTQNRKEFYDLCWDIYFQILQNQNLEDFLQPLINYMFLAEVNEFSYDILSIFLAERDLHGVLTHIKKHLDDNNNNTLNIDELRTLLNEIIYSNNDNKNITNNISLELERLRNLGITSINIMKEYAKIEAEYISELAKQIKSL